MLELSTQEVVCPECKKSFYPETAAKSANLCGDQLSPRTDQVAKVLDCKIYYFCSEECYNRFKKRSTNQKVSRWAELLKRISKASFESGITGVRSN